MLIVTVPTGTIAFNSCTPLALVRITVLKIPLFSSSCNKTTRSASFTDLSLSSPPNISLRTSHKDNQLL